MRCLLFQVVFGFNQYTSITDVDKKISSLTFEGGSCNAGAALNECQTSLFDGDAGGRRRILLVIMTGTSDDDISTTAGSLSKTGVKIIAVGMGLSYLTAGVLKGDFSNAAAVLKTTGVKIIAVGIGASVDNSQLSTIASPASSVLNVVSYTDLTDITDGVCKIVPKGIRNEKIQIPYPVLIFVTNSHLFPNLMNQLSLSQTVIDSCVFNF